ncbi:hypothetical protein LLE49_01760 [Alicyclobacillus tolerans]|uniref:CBO0543 family protein n=1 Tax=Alicyclobacillus tolerans TaxID=90970 RepID=UPI001F43A28B|nr:CBO0543 family protein [Alicyclobacillus tolerans]MCF8563469.1 hypothetical protein [Alicyclobacillus tolerans]
MLIPLGQQVQKIVDQCVEANRQYLVLWKQHILFRGVWWFEVALLVVPLMLWGLFHKRDSTDRLAYTGLIVLLVSAWLDFIGNSYGLWYYPYKLIPVLPPFIPWEAAIVVEALALLQWKPQASPYWKAVLFGAFNAFAMEPLMHKTGIYQPLHWPYIYSFPVYGCIFLAAHWVSRRHRFAELE